jgi:glycosyltransferase involved in cell wall biosynthesis
MVIPVPRISFICPNFNRADYVLQTLDSLRAQHDPRWEAVVVDDGSTDDSPAMIEAAAAVDSRIRFYRRSRQPKGACTCRNEAVTLAHGDLLIFLDTDDLVTPECARQRIAQMDDQPELDFAIFPATLFRDQPGDLNIWWNIDNGRPLLERQFHQDAICQGTGPVFRKESFLRVGGWDTSLALWQDIDLFFRMFIQGYRYKICFDHPADLHIRRHDSSLSRGNFFARPKQVSRVRVLQTALDLLRRSDMSQWVRESRFMLAEIFSGGARSAQFDLCQGVMGLDREHQVFTKAEVRLLRSYFRAYRFHLYRLPLWSTYLEYRFNETFDVRGHIGAYDMNTPLVTTG